MNIKEEGPALVLRDCFPGMQSYLRSLTFIVLFSTIVKKPDLVRDMCILRTYIHQGDGECTTIRCIVLPHHDASWCKDATATVQPD